MKMFYTMDEAKARLSRTESDVLQFIREGRLREFRDGKRVMLKADQVDDLAEELGIIAPDIEPYPLPPEQKSSDFINLAKTAISNVVSAFRDSRNVRIVYTNWKGETAVRTIIPQSIWFGHTEYHKEDQWLLKAIDVEKEAERDFALKDVRSWF